MSRRGPDPPIPIQPPGFYLWVLGKAGANLGCSETIAQGSPFSEAYLSFLPILSQKAPLSQGRPLFICQTCPVTHSMPVLVAPELTLTQCTLSDLTGWGEGSC